MTATVENLPKSAMRHAAKLPKLTKSDVLRGHLNIRLACIGFLFGLSANISAQAQSANHEPKLQALACSELTSNSIFNYFGRNSPAPLGIPESDWTPQLYAIFKERALSCAASAPNRERADVQSRLRFHEYQILSRSSQLRSSREAEEERSRRRQADILAYQEEQKRQAKAAEEAKQAEQARQADLQAEAERTANAFKERMAAFSAPVQAFINRNPTLEKLPKAAADEYLLAMYTLELSLRICNTNIGGYRSELKEMTRRREVFEGYLRDAHGGSEATFKTNRDAFGVETGSGRVADVMSADRTRLIQSCDQALAYLSSVFDFTP